MCMALTKQYFSLLNDYRHKYGSKTFLLMQVGSFYEFYATSESDEHIQAFTSICDLKIAQKGDNHFMAGFRDYVLDKYLSRLNETEYTTVVYIQEEIEPGVFKRREYGVFSPGTTFIDDDQRLTNNISCLWIYKSKVRTVQPGMIVFGISNIDIYTGKVDLYEYEHVFYHNPTTYDDIERFISIYNPNELVVIHNIEDTIVDSILQFINVKSKKITRVNLNDKSSSFTENALKCESQVFQNEIIRKFYPCLSINAVLTSLYDKTISFQSLCFLLDFVSQHNPSLAKNLDEPCLNKNTHHLLLANHSLKQLNIIDSGDYEGSCSSVLKLLNTCRTKIGKREFQRILLNPSCNIEELKQSYDMIEQFISNGYNWSDKLSQLCDIEKIHRKIILEKALPSEYYQLYHTCQILLHMNINDKSISEYLQYQNTVYEIHTIMDTLERFMKMDVAKYTNELNESCEQLILKGIDFDLDQACRDKMESKDKFDAILQFLNKTYTDVDKKCSDGFKVHETDKNGVSIHITKKRWGHVKSTLTRFKDITLHFYSKYSETNDTFTFDTTKLDVEDYNASTYVVLSKELNQLTQLMMTTSCRFEVNLKRVYATLHSRMNISYDSIIYTIRHLDVLNTKSETAIKYNYSKPTIDEGCSKSYFKANGIRHVLIERLDKDETYVTNDICLGEENQGMLLYGTNAVGKTSLIKAIGISIIMAQSGMFVPCSSFTYHPYEYLFTRIIGNDNLFKGLSTFAVEMSELRVILQQCNDKSLILGDELCSGTEIDSALSIFVAGLETMYAKQSTFIFATHFHSIQSFDEINHMPLLTMKHLAVKYNHELKQLVYDRKLQDGPGDSVYGLEVCKSLNLPDSFLSRAYEIRNKYNVTTTSVLSLPTTKYNKDKIRGMCEFCKKYIGTETHHLKYQKNAIHDHIGGVHKDHVANLASICEACHVHIHQLGLVYEKRKTLDGKYNLILKREESV